MNQEMDTARTTDINSAIFDYCLRLGDNSLILGHRLSEWCGHAPELEEDLAMANIALDLIGQATLVYEIAGKHDVLGRSPDELAYLRDAMDFRNAALLEQPNSDFAQTILRQFLFDCFQSQFLPVLTKSRHPDLAAFAEKSLKEATYHLRHSSKWLLVLGRGTEESLSRLQKGLDELWMYNADLFAHSPSDEMLIAANLAPDFSVLYDPWISQVYKAFLDAGLQLPEAGYLFKGSRQGRHTEALGYILAEMQYLQKTYPGAKW